MHPGELFELKCYKYLKNKYTSEKVKFLHKGGMDSTESDIAVFKDKLLSFYVEAKDPIAQSGQFVLIPNNEAKTFTFSKNNRSLPNEMTNIIIKYMNNNFNKFVNAGTAGEKLNIDNSVFSNWIIKHYENKNVKYIISYNQNFIIFPIRKFAEYFIITGNYRIKKSGSGTPAKKDIDIIKDYIKSVYSSAIFSQEGKKLFVSISTPINKNKFNNGKYTYYLSKQKSNLYEIRKLSNTHNMNVIFSIKLIKNQSSDDLMEFEKDIHFI